MISFYSAVFSIACYYSVVSFVLRYPTGVDHGTDPFAFALLMAAAMLFSIGQTAQRAARVLCTAALFLPAPALLWNHAIPGILEYTLPWGYLVYLSCRRPRSLSHYYFKSSFAHILWGFFPMLLFLLFRPERGVAALYEAAPYLIIFLGAGVSLLQALRHKQEQGKSFIKHQSIQTAIFFLLCILLTVGGGLEFLENVFLKKILRPAVLLLLDGLFGGAKYIGDGFLKKKPRQMEKSTMDYVEKTIEKRPVPPAPGRVSEPKPITHGEINYMLIVVLLVVLAAVVIFLVLRNNTKKQVRQIAVLDEREKLPAEEADHKKRRGRDMPQELIREYYRKFMRITDVSAHKLKAQDTTQEIRGKYTQDREEKKAREYAQALTEIYRVARYREDADGQEGHGFSDFAVQKADMQRGAKRMKILLDYLKKV